MMMQIPLLIHGKYPGDTGSSNMGTISGYYSTVQKILTRVTANTLREFETLKSDEQRAEYVLSLEYVKDAFKIKPVVEGKSPAESKRLREKGNVYFQKRDYKEALSLYNKATVMAPMHQPGAPQYTTDSDEFVLALGNRSATLFKLRECKRCLEDINVALKYGYPTHLLYKLYDRQARCYQELGQLDNALESFTNILGVIDKAKLEDSKKESVVKGVKRQMAALRGTAIGEDLNISDTSGSSNSTTELRMAGVITDDDSLVKPTIAGRDNKIYPGTCDSFQVKYGPEKGRYGVASNDITVGDVVVVDDPYVCVLDPSQHEHRCYHCFRKLKLPISCHQCVKVLYCTESCRETSWEQYHGLECPFVIPLTSSGTGSISLLALRVVVKTGLHKILKYKKNPFSDKRDAKQSLFTSKGVYMGGYMGIYNLVAHTSERSRNDILQYTILAVYLLRILEQAGFFEDMDSLEVRSSIGGLLLRLLQIICCNGVEIMEMRTAQVLQRTNPEPIGLALYPTVSLLNHSCDPNLELIFYDNTCVVRAIQNVPTGRELCIDYGQLYYVTPKKQRVLSLRSQYFFECRCHACTKEWSVKSNLKCDIPILKCVKCSYPILNMFSMYADSDDQDPSQQQCRRCGLVQNPLEVFEKLQKSAVLFERAVDQARRWETKRAVPMLQHHLGLLDKHVCLPWKDYVTCVSTIKQCYRMEGNRDKDPPSNCLLE